MENLAIGIGLGAWMVYGITLVGHLFITMRFRVKISISLLKRCSLHDIKETVKNAWTNIGITTSLVMTTIIGALIEGHEITPQGFCTDHLTLLHIKQIYVALCMACLFANVNCIIYCVLSLFYWDSLSQTDAMAFLRENPQVLGETVIYMVESYILFIAAIATWIYGTYGQTFITGIFPCFALSALINLSIVWGNLHFFYPKDPHLAHQIRLERRCCCCSCGRRKPGVDCQNWIRVMDAISELQPSESAEEKPKKANTVDSVDTPKATQRRQDEISLETPPEAPLATLPAEIDNSRANHPISEGGFSAKEWHVWRVCH